ncbi:MAG: glyoxylase-like metal-dependent hydrolase (beta-lactamase superfamily II) [Cellvibrionaceae bacterium]|jgi:glyoxylase-like metal-dependent hydrolase (beta-lactamase superfamily II)
MNKPIRVELPTPFAIGSVNAWLFTEPEPILVDCGQKTADCIQALVAGLAEHNLTIGDLKKVVITHAHVDHAGLAGYIAENSEAEFWVSEYAWEWVCDLDTQWAARTLFMHETVIKGGMPAATAEKLHASMGRIHHIWEPVPVERMVRFTTDSKLQMGGSAWDVIYAPGHTTSQTCFFEPESGMLISADMLLHMAPVPVIERNAQLEEDGTVTRAPGLLQHMRSLETFYALDATAVFPGHGDEFAKPHREMIDRQRGRIHKRKEQCYELVAAGNQTIFGLTNIMYAHFPEDSRITGFAMVLGYLDLLIDEKRVLQEIDDGVWQFKAA